MITEDYSLSLCSFMANFCCSIESEPRTLKQGQLEQAREVAVGNIILQKKETTDQASNLSVERLKLAGVVEKEEEEEEEEKNTSEINKGTVPCQCSCNSISSPILDSPLDQSKFKEPLSAPF